MQSGRLRLRGKIIKQGRSRSYGGSREFAWYIEKTRWGSFKNRSTQETKSGESLQGVSKDTWMMRYDPGITSDNRIVISGSTFEIEGIRHDPIRKKWTICDLVLVTDSTACFDEHIVRYEDGRRSHSPKHEIDEYDIDEDNVFEDGICYRFEDDKPFTDEQQPAALLFEDGNSYEFEDDEQYVLDEGDVPILFEDGVTYEFEDGEEFEWDFILYGGSFEDGEPYIFEDNQPVQYENG